MNRERVEIHLEAWRDYMRTDKTKLGYPSKSLMIATGGASSGNAFEIMCEEMDETIVRAIDAIIDSLRNPERVAIYHHWLQDKHFYPTQAMDYEIALETIAKIADRKGII